MKVSDGTVPTIVDITRTFYGIPDSSNRHYTTKMIPDFYAYGVQPMKNSRVIMTAERRSIPVIVLLDENGGPLGTADVHSEYMGISSPQVVGDLCFFVTYDTEADSENPKLCWWDISDASALREIGSADVPLRGTVLRVYDLGVVPCAEGYTILIRALVRDETTGLHSEDCWLLHKTGQQINVAGTLPLMSSYNELRSVSLFQGLDSNIYCIASRRYWLKNQAFLFQILPDERLLAEREIPCRAGDFQQAGVIAEDAHRISLMCIHRHRKDNLGIHYNIEEFR